MAIIEAPMIGGRYPAMASVRLEVSAGKRDFSVLAPVVTEALKAVGLSVGVGDGFLTIAGRHEAQLPVYRMDDAIWNVLISKGYELGAVTPVSVRNVFSGGQHGAARPRMYMYEGIPLFVAKGEGSDALMNTVRDFARESPSGTPDFDHIVERLKKPPYVSQRWAPLMNDTRDLGVRALFTGQDVPDITYFADSMIAMIEGDEGLKYIPIPNTDGKPRYVETWKQLTSSF